MIARFDPGGPAGMTPRSRDLEEPNRMKILFHGAARTVTGSMHLIEANGSRVCLDCGLFQGRRKEARRRNREFPVPPSELDAVLLGHAHIDHCGNLPTLGAQGFDGLVYSTPATRDLCAYLLRDSAHIQRLDAEYLNRKNRRKGLPLIEPLYTAEDAERILERFASFPFHRRIRVAPGIHARFYIAGHILGSAVTIVEVEEKGRTTRIGYAVDLGRMHMPIIRDPEPMPDLDILLMESTYGGRTHESAEGCHHHLGEVIRRTVERGGKIIVPSFALGRTQEILYCFRRLLAAGEVPKIPVFVDSPLAVDLTGVFRLHPEAFDREMADMMMRGESPFSFPGLEYVTSAERSKQLNEDRRPMMIISASGMCEAGRILHHLKHNIENPRSTILIVGYMAENTLGRRIRDGEEEVRIYGETYRPRAEVVVMDAFSAHADHNDLVEYARRVAIGCREIFLVHGEYEAQQKLRDGLKEIGLENVRIPDQDEVVEL